MKIAVVGTIAKDIIVIDGVTKQCIGGSPYYEAHSLHMLGAEVKVFATYGKNDENLVKENFKGIKVEATYAQKTITHQLTYLTENPDIREVKVPEYSPNVFSFSDSTLEELRSYDYILLGPLYYENIPYEFFEKMKGSNLVINNFGLFTYFENGIPVRKNPENLAKVAKFLKYLFLDEDEIKFASQLSDMEAGAEYFLNLGVDNVIVTRGSKGSVVFTNEKRYDIPAFPLEKLIDPTGAGDTYLAAFIFATTIFKDIQKQGEFAAMAATMAIEKSGAFGGNVEEVLGRLNNVENI